MLAGQLLVKVRDYAKKAYVRGYRRFTALGLKFEIRFAHDNEYQVILPTGDELFRLIDNGRSVQVIAV